MKIDPKEITVPRFQGYMQSAVIPRPIALASTLDAQGRVNLSPFSFFNCFGSNPPTLVFSPARRVRDNTTKHTLHNVKAVKEVVINLVSHAMVEQASLASCEYPEGVDEFLKAGFTPVASERVKPPRVSESPVSFECKVREVVELGQEGGAGALVICEVLLMHVKDEVMVDGRIDPLQLDLVARLGGDQYLRMNREGLFTVPKPNEKLGIGFDALPSAVKHSTVLTGNDLGRLANAHALPATEAVREFQQQESIAHILARGEEATHRLAQHYLRNGQTEDAWKVLLRVGD